MAFGVFPAQSPQAVLSLRVTSSQHLGGVHGTAQYLPLPEKPCRTARLPLFPTHLLHRNSTLYTDELLNSDMDLYCHLDSVSRKMGGTLFEFHFLYLVEYITAGIIVCQ